MQKKNARVVLVTGASSGIGRATAARLAADGHRVFGSSREPTGDPPAGVTMVSLDVRDDASVATCFDVVERAAGPIEVLVANAGRMAFGAVEEVADADARDMFETNFWGAARVVRAALPSMRARCRGHVVIVGSVAATVAIPLNGYYAASKAALARYAEALRHEVDHLGVRVALIGPSDYKTGFWQRATIAGARFADYQPVRESLEGALRAMRAAAPEPSPVADAIATVVASDRPDGVVRVGAWARRLAWMRALMPDAAFDAGLRRRFGLPRRGADRAREAAGR